MIITSYHKFCKLVCGGYSH